MDAVSDKRELLSSKLKQGYKKINSLNAKTRKVKAAQGFVMMKRDKVGREVEEQLKSIQLVLGEMKSKFEENLKEVVNEKIAELETEIEEIQDDVCMLMEICVESENTLKLGNETLLDKHTSALTKSFDILFETDESILDYDKMIVMDYQPYNIEQYLFKKNLGFVMTSKSAIPPPQSENTDNKSTQTTENKTRDSSTQASYGPMMPLNMRNMCPPSFIPQAINYNNMLLSHPAFMPYVPQGTTFFGSPNGIPGMQPHPHPMNVNNMDNYRTTPTNMADYMHPQPRQPSPNTSPIENMASTSTPVQLRKDYLADIQKMAAAERYVPLFSTDLSNRDISTNTGVGMESRRSSGLPENYANLESISRSSTPTELDTRSDQENKRPPRLPGNKLKTPLTSNPTTDDNRIRFRSYSVRFSPTSTSSDTNSRTLPQLSHPLHMPKSIQELKNLQRHSSAVNIDGKNGPLDSSEVIVIDDDQDLSNHSNQPLSRKTQKNKNLNNSLANESWDEELVIIEDLTLDEGDEEMSGNNQPHEDTIKTSHREHKQEKVRKASVNDSGIATDLYQTSDAWGNNEHGNGLNKEKHTKHPDKIISTEYKDDKVKTESCPKSVNLSQFKSLFVKHIESNVGIPTTGPSPTIYGQKRLQEIVNSKPIKFRCSATNGPKEVKFSVEKFVLEQTNNQREMDINLSYCFGKQGVEPSFSEMLNFPIGVNVNSSGEIIVNDTSNHLIKKFKEKTLVKVMGLGDVQLQRPSAIVVNKSDDIFVKDNVAIHVFSKNGDFKHSFGGKLKQPYGLVMTEDETLIVLDLCRPTPYLHEFKQDGEFISSYPYQPLLNLPAYAFSKCRFMAYHNGKILVSDLGRSMMYLTTRHGAIISIFSRKGFGPGEFNEPSGITVDGDGNWVVADSRNNRLQVFKPNGEFLCILKFKQPVIRPSDIHITPSGSLYVVDFLAHMVKVYHLNRATS